LLKQRVIDLAPDFMVKLFAAPYIAGDSAEAAVRQASSLWSGRRLKSTIDLLGEELTRRDDVQQTVTEYLRLVDLLGRHELATLSLKPTQLGSHESVDVCADHIGRIAAYAVAQGIGVTIDMEDHTCTDITLEVYRRLLPRFPGLGTVLQTRLHRTAADIEALKGRQARIRLCIGIYLEPADIALQKKPEMKERVLTQGERLLDDGHYVEFATHDEALIGKILDMIARRGFGGSQFEFQMLLGVPRDAVQQRLIAEGHTVRLYVPYAVKWSHALGYAKRRLAANPNMGLYVARNLIRGISKSAARPYRAV
jgi:proline dehydrogenase